MKTLTPITIFILALYVTAQCQNWDKLVPLESNREEVEKVLGKPQKYFKGSGTYRTEIGKFSILYSIGGCPRNPEGPEWNVPAGKMINLLVYLNNSLPLESYVSNVKDFKREASPGGYSRYHYTSPDETIIYETIMRKDGTEFVYTIELQPSKGQKHLLCKEK